jgi:Myb-like DNA-binding domain
MQSPAAAAAAAAGMQAVAAAGVKAMATAHCSQQVNHRPRLAASPENGGRAFVSYKRRAASSTKSGAGLYGEARDVPYEEMRDAPRQQARGAPCRGRNIAPRHTVAALPRGPRAAASQGLRALPPRALPPASSHSLQAAPCRDVRPAPPASSHSLQAAPCRDVRPAPPCEPYSAPLLASRPAPPRHLRAAPSEELQGVPSDTLYAAPSDKFQVARATEKQMGVPGAMHAGVYTGTPAVASDHATPPSDKPVDLLADTRGGVPINVGRTAPRPALSGASIAAPAGASSVVALHSGEGSRVKIESKLKSTVPSVRPVNTPYSFWSLAEQDRLDAAIVGVARAQFAPRGDMFALVNIRAVAAKAGLNFPRVEARIRNRTQTLRRWVKRVGESEVARANATDHGRTVVILATGRQHRLPWDSTEVARLDAALELVRPQDRSAAEEEIVRGVREIRDGTFNKIVKVVGTRSAEHVLFQLQRTCGWAEECDLDDAVDADDAPSLCNKVIVCDVLTGGASRHDRAPLGQNGGNLATGFAAAESISTSPLADGPSSQAASALDAPAAMSSSEKQRRVVRQWVPAELARFADAQALHAAGKLGPGPKYHAISAHVRTRTPTQCRKRWRYERWRVSAKAKTLTPAKCEAVLDDVLLSPASTVPSLRDSDAGNSERPLKKLRFLRDAPPTGKQEAEKPGTPQAAQDADFVQEGANYVGNDVYVSGNGRIVVCLRCDCPLPPIPPVAQFRAEREARKHAGDERHLSATPSGSSRRQSATLAVVRNAVRPSSRGAVQSDV